MNLHDFFSSLGNFAVFRNRNKQGQLVSMHQSGTHWLKHILAMALTKHYGLPAPEFNHSNDIIGGPRDPVIYSELPNLVSSHSIPHPSLRLNFVHSVFRLPPYVVLVRDIRRSLISNYFKWKNSYNVSFKVFLRGAQSPRFNSDVWWTINFINQWGFLAKNNPNKIIVVRYEDLQKDGLNQVLKICKHWNLKLTIEEIIYGINQSHKSIMIKKDDPSRPKGAVNNSNMGLELFDYSDRNFFEKICKKNLKIDLGYSYNNWD